jgi:hypothetical protein
MKTTCDRCSADLPTAQAVVYNDRMLCPECDPLRRVYRDMEAKAARKAARAKKKETPRC